MPGVTCHAVVDSPVRFSTPNLEPILFIPYTEAMVAACITRVLHASSMTSVIADAGPPVGALLQGQVDLLTQRMHTPFYVTREVVPPAGTDPHVINRLPAIRRIKERDGADHARCTCSSR